MNAIAANQRWIMIGWLHFAAALACAAYSLGMGGAGYVDEIRGAGFSLFDLAGIVLGLILVTGPLFAEAGLLMQRRYNARGFWRALFVVCTVLTALMLVVDVARYVVLPETVGAAALEALFMLIALGQLVALWLYAYRSDHLWAVMPA